MAKVGKAEYLAKVQKLSAEEAERLLSRMTGKLPRRLEKDKLSREEAMALQMELEDEQLQEWRNVMANVKKKEEAKKKAKTKGAERSKATAKGKTSAKAAQSSKAAAAKTAKSPTTKDRSAAKD